MRFKLAISVILLVSSGAASELKLDRQPGKLVIQSRARSEAGWTALLTYVMEKGKRPYLHPVHDASGKQVLTDDRPADHPWQHGIFTGFHRVNGFNYWKEDQGQQRFMRLLDLKEEPAKIAWTSLIELIAPNGDVVLEEENTIVVHAPESADSYRIDFTLVLRAKEKEVQFGKFFVGGLSVRMPWDKENPRQTHLNSNGLRGRAGEQKRAAWCMVEQPFGNDVFGFAIFDHPSNSNHPPAWRVDEQGLINPNVSGLSDWSIPPGEERRFEYRILVYRGPARKAQLVEEFDRFGKR